MEPGLAPGDLRFTLTTLYGSDFDGGHFSRNGNTPSGAAVPVPLYRHETSLDYLRLELGLQYTLAPHWDVIARIPWEQKDQQSSIGFIEAATDAERAAMQRNVDLHHRTTTLRGLADLMLLGRRRFSRFNIAFGTTIPTGSTVDDPYALGDRGVEHQHIQFGTGTFDPLVEASYLQPLSERLTAGVSLNARVPLYENRRGFRAPPDGSLSVHLSRRFNDRLQARLEGTAFAQGYGSWDGLRDENTGLVATSIAAGASMPAGDLSLSADVRFPLAQRTLDEGDAFTQGPTFIVSISGKL